ncbi:uncharacterized protein EAE97_006224 [Botrytis byssoidea]|uniref:Uncharacterized protein n=1 Tax=Botrytis byssoidea TaxID=139641 RepID=A0A9P5IMK4_9HELO|nr:uncharacterized protein EAE97_006224 [Botrytis byssoidea]KAF7942770.1 hypothetical protein EAE97_006224 [Botrytis byssoidea]
MSALATISTPKNPCSVYEPGNSLVVNSGPSFPYTANMFNLHMLPSLGTWPAMPHGFYDL